MDHYAGMSKFTLIYRKMEIQSKLIRAIHSGDRREEIALSEKLDRIIDVLWKTGYLTGPVYSRQSYSGMANQSSATRAGMR